MILLGCEFCLFELAISVMYGLPFVGPAIVVWLRLHRKPKPKHTHEPDLIQIGLIGKPNEDGA